MWKNGLTTSPSELEIIHRDSDIGIQMRQMEGGDKLYNDPMTTFGHGTDVDVNDDILVVNQKTYFKASKFFCLISIKTKDIFKISVS